MAARTFAVLVNPAAGGGRATAALHAVQAELTRLGRIANAAARAHGRLVDVHGALRALADARSAGFDVDGATRSFQGWSVAVAHTSAYGGGMQLAPDARTDDGVLDVVLVAGRSRRRVLLPA